ncbi:nucleoside-diphosphate sugar epimerase/dehydratase [Sanguibacter sp. HDW7]|uniref:polysaccharide biosynthesis protein n=1 Tax=Sanguibacter sp. HDW7 TaxID=2714931 RepID=UPI00197CCB6D|nr:nucleoside-diphosphate sugar epimerase/dehydratase [Sanguibacter sp. HDW7]
MLYNPVLRRATVAAWDVACWVVATVFVVGIRYDFTINADQTRSTVIYMAVSGVLLVGIGYAVKLYRGRYRIASFDEALALAALALVVGIVTLLVFVVAGDELPRAIAFLVPAIALIAMAGGRWAYRARRRVRQDEGGDRRRVLIYGAGDAGHQLLRVILTDSAAKYTTVGFIDDNPAKRNLRLVGVPVLGARDDLVHIAAERDVDTVILAVSRIKGERLGEIQDLVEGAGLEFLAIPSLSSLIGGRVQLRDVKEVDITDVLGRHQIDTDLGAIADYLSGKRVLITGAGGSIGSELARQVYRFGPSELVLLDRDESALHSVQLSIYGKGLLDTRDMVLVDIRDRDALRAVFEEHRPEIVFHAAALKHLPMLEMYPEEGWKTNVLGTYNLLGLAAETGVTHFVNVSTDKAADPTSVLGRTKRVAEQLTAWQSARAEGTYMSVRFGNVLGSRGSMLHTFNAQIEAGGPLTVTHPDVTRFFMTIPEACQLVIQAGAIGSPGSVLVLDMGQPVKILDVARRLVARSGRNIEIVFTGLRPGEKMHEDLFGTAEDRAETGHPLISHVPVPAIDPADLERVHDEQEDAR